MARYAAATPPAAPQSLRCCIATENSRLQNNNDILMRCFERRQPLRRQRLLRYGCTGHTISRAPAFADAAVAATYARAPLRYAAATPYAYASASCRQHYACRHATPC